MESLIEVINTPLSYGFMQRALLVSITVGTVCSIFSCFLILKGWSLMGDAVSHAVLPGIALAYIYGIPLFVGAFVAGIACGIFTGLISEHSRVKEDAVMGIVFSGMFAIGLVILTKIETDIHLMHVLFGNLLGISNADLYEILTLSCFCSFIMILKRKDFMLYCFDPIHAGVIGLKTKFMHIGLLILLTLTIVSSLKAAGIILVIAMLIAPGAIAFLCVQSFGKMLALAVTVSVSSCIAGTYISFYLDTATAPLIVLIQAVIFIVVLLGQKLRPLFQYAH